MSIPIEPHLRGCSQLLVVRCGTTAARPATMMWLERSGSAWRPVVDAFPVLTGRGGLAWSGGLLPPVENRTDLPPKREGDLRTPCGLFGLSFAFGAAPSLAENPGWPYLRIDDGFVIVDDPGSRYYNCVVDERLLRAPDWKSARRLLQPDGRNDLGLVVHHNLDPAVPGAGSGVLLQLRRGTPDGTDGSTALPEDRMQALLRFLDPMARPLLWQAPAPTSAG